MNKTADPTPAMKKFYFTYGTDLKYPFQGGWSLIYAPDLRSAQQIFKAVHPNREGSDCLNCADYYTAEQFMQTDAFREGNRGAKCHEVICPRPPETDGMETLEERDAKLEELWKLFGEIPMYPDTECMEDNFLHFPAGTHREEVWKWFDQRHSKGVGHLLYSDGNDHTADLATLAYRKTLCGECDCTECGFQSDGLCKFALVHGEKPSYDDHRGCLGYTEKPELCWRLEAQDGV